MVELDVVGWNPPGMVGVSLWLGDHAVVQLVHPVLFPTMYAATVTQRPQRCVHIMPTMGRLFFGKVFLEAVINCCGLNSDVMYHFAPHTVM